MFPSECDHDGWKAGCPNCERQYAYALERVDPDRHRETEAYRHAEQVWHQRYDGTEDVQR
jgi:NAD(P)H-nitrite reductase large subunit